MDPQSWDLFDYGGIRLGVTESDGKKYTLVLKDEAPLKRPDGRQESSISWEYDFVPSGTEVVASWEDFKPRFRGKPKDDAGPLRLDRIKTISLMMRRFVTYPHDSPYVSHC